MLTATLALGLATLGPHAPCRPAGELPDAREFQRKAEAYLETHSEPGAPGVVVLVARGDEVLLRRACGLANIELGVPLSPDHVFRIGSNSKQFTAATILKLAEAGKLSLDDPLSKFLPDYPNGQHITIHELLNHTSGVFDYTEAPDFLTHARADVDLPALIAEFKNHAPDFPPGTGSRYSSSDYVLLSAVIEKVTGRSWDQAIRQLVLDPLRLEHTRAGSDAPLLPGRAAGYSRGEHGEVTNAAYISMTQTAGAGGLVSTADDLFRWTRALHTGRVLSEERYRQMITPVPNVSGGPTDYGYGLFVSQLRGEKLLWHGGLIPGFLSLVGYVPESQITVVLLFNSDALDPDPEMLMRQLAAAIGKPYPERHAVALTDAQLRELQGIYRIDDKTRRVLSVRNHQLFSQRGEGEPKRLLAASVNELYMEGTLDYFAVVRDASGKVTALDQFASGEPPALRQEKMGDPVPADSIR